ncbi:MAG: FAD-dependent oxidoreductase [Spirosomaceae bacterium]|nr:FAD-dependent oxidoreductase [Spirosomataceae bacterium]
MIQYFCNCINTAIYFSKFMKTCLIIGAGMSGLTAATDLQNNGWKVTVLDKGRGVGGRMSTRRIADGRADHGGQYFSAKTPEFQAFTEKLIADNVAAEWQVAGKDFARFVGKNGMSDIPKFMAKGLDIRTGERANKIEKTASSYIVSADSGNSYETDALILTSPAPQTIDLLNDVNFEVNNSVIEALNSIEYLPCISVMALLNAQTKIPKPGNLTFENEAIAWIADNTQKGISEPQTVTIHASAAYSQDNLEGNLEEIRDELLSKAAEWVSPESIVEKQIHRWRYSLANKRYNEPFLAVNETLLLGGDGFGIGNIEGAFLSGKAMAAAL